MLSALAAVVIFAQAAPDAAQSSAAPPLAAPTPAEGAKGVITTSMTTTPQVKAKTVSPVEISPEQRKLNDEVAKRQLVCEKQQVIGTLFPKQVCATKEEIADRRNLDQAEVRKMQALRPYRTN